MFAVIRASGKQYKVVQDEVLPIDRVAGAVGAKLTLGEVLLLGGDAIKTGAPLVAGASVEAEILEQGRGPKVVAFKKKRRKNTHRKRGGRAHFTKIKITGINAG
jgi:large subunit ribosomal protein L21